MQPHAPDLGATIARTPFIVTALILGCSRAPAPSAEPGIHEHMVRYQHALNTRTGTTEERLAACLALVDPGLAGDCALVVTQEATSSGEDPARLCGLVPPGMWQAECFFEQAEALRQRDKPLAVALCQRAGAFAEDCQQHLWQGELKRLVDRGGPDAFGAQLEQAQALFEEWATLLGDDPRYRHNFWLHYYQAGLGGMIPLDLEVCEPLPALHRERCLEAGVASFEAMLEAAMRSLPNQDVICSPRYRERPLEQLGAIGPRGQVLPHPRLEEALEGFRQDSCIRGGPGGLRGF
jgi:hypothetical protein